MVEEWRKVEGFPDYMVSNEGRVLSMKREIPVILKAENNGHGYLLVNLYDKNKTSHRKSVHRLVASAFIPNTENKTDVNHISGVKTDNCCTNLEWCTSSENMRHAYATGLQKSPCHIGIKHPLTRLTEEQVITIYMLAHSGTVTQMEIGKLYGITRGEVGHIKTGRTWGHVTKYSPETDTNTTQAVIC